MLNLIANQNAYYLHDIYLVVVISLCIILTVLVLFKFIKNKIDNQSKDITTSKATCVTIQERMSALNPDKIAKKYVTFQLENKELYEFCVNPDLVDDIMVNQVGVLTYQGSIYLDFQLL